MSSGGDNKEESQIMDVLAFCKLLGKLKHLPRAGWVRYNNPAPESVASHMYRMAVLAFFLNEKNQNFSQTKCIKMALVHDMAESIVGDITPHCGISEEEKFRRENEGMKHIRSLVPDTVGEEFYQLWREYEAQETIEAKVVKQLDKFDLIMQAYEYETDTEKPKSLQEFFNSTDVVFENGMIRDWVKQLNDARNKKL